MNDIEPDLPPPVDMDFIQSVTGDDKDFTRELFMAFVAEVEASLPRIDQAMNPFKGAEVRTLVHSFVGTASCLGANRLREIAQALEAHSLARRYAESQESYTVFREELLRVKEFVKSQVEQLDGGN